jgi:uncharacterized membrane protein YeaQ/YmgE (transglycosylase-associated protein family)
MTMTAAAPAQNLRWLRYTGAFVAGFATVAVLSMVTDAVLHATSVYPNDGTTGGDGALAFALAYRTVFTVLGGYLAARLAPAHGLPLSIILGIVGTLAATAGAVAMWHVGSHWYPAALAALALPSTTLGGWLFSRSSR